MSVQFQIYSPAPPSAHAGSANRTIRWRLVASNNRAMAGSARDFADFTAARADIADLLERLSRAEVRMATAADDRWRWTLLLDGDPAAWSVRTYIRRLECEHSVANVVRLAPLAEPARTLRVFGDHRGRVVSRADAQGAGADARPPALTHLVMSAADLPIIAGAAPRFSVPDGGRERRPPVAPTSRERRAVPQ